MFFHALSLNFKDKVLKRLLPTTARRGNYSTGFNTRPSIRNGVAANKSTTPQLGSSIYVVHKNIKVFDLSHVHMRPHEPDSLPFWTFTYHWHKHTLLKQLVQNGLLGLKLKFNYNNNCYLLKTVLFVIYTTDLCWRKVPLFIPSE